MIGKIPTWWENSVHGNRKTVGKIPPWWEISLSGRKKVFRCMDHLVLGHPSYMRGFTYPFSLSVAGRNDNPMPESTLSPQSGTMNLDTDFINPIQNPTFKGTIYPTNTYATPVPKDISNIWSSLCVS
jgi:hypothetical protein